MHLVIVSAFNYPDGGPAAQRHIALALGLARAGHDVSFILLTQAEPPDLSGAHDRIQWHALGTRRSLPGPGWRLKAVQRLRKALDTIASTAPVDGLLLVDRDPVLLGMGLRAAHRRGLLALHEITEFPDVVERPGLAGMIATSIFERRHLPALDGILVISRALAEYAARRTRTPLLRVGGLIDLPAHPRFPPLALGPTLAIGYAGSLSQAKDGVLSLLRAVAADVAERGTDSVHLHVVGGDLKSDDGRAALAERARLGLEGNVTFHGQVPHARVAAILTDCHLLALPRPVSRQATGGFPTKLGEYLSSARPVLCTAVGEIPRHLRDGETAILCAPNDVAALSRAIGWAALNYPEAVQIGGNGRVLAERQFAAETQAARIATFVSQLRTRRA